MSVDFGYFRRNYVNFDAWDNRNIGAEDFVDRYTITVPEDPIGCPNGGGYPISLSWT